MNTAPEPESGADFSGLEAACGHTFRRRDLLALALIHDSAGGVKASESNERLEFLGDRVLGLAVAEMLLERFPDEAEGDIARRHSALVRKETLVEIAREIDLGPCITAEKSLNTEEPSVLADALEAVIAAVHLDGGWEAARAFIVRFWAAHLEDLAAAGPPRDAKSRLQEWLQARSGELPVYREISRRGPSQAPVFTIEVRAENYAAQGEGRSKRAAEQAAAELVLGALGGETTP